MPVGIVSAVFGARCEVLHEGGELSCLLRGRLRQSATSLAPGDRVEFARVDARTGVVEAILERRNELARPNRERPRRRSGPGAYERQVVLANPDQVIFVAAARDPGIDFNLLDRALALARAARLPAAVCVNKMDLAPDADIRRLMLPYELLRFPVLYVSAAEGRGLEPLRELLQGRTSFFWGGSGVGKSSLIRALTGREVKVGHWRAENPRGPHTTNVTRLYPLPGGGLIADTPGFDWLELDLVTESEDAVELLLPEATALAKGCRFPGCSHRGEPDCAVMAAVLSGEVDRARYARYRAAAAEADPLPRLPLEMLAAGDDLFFRMREANTSIWTAFSFHFLFDSQSPEREGLLERLAVPPGSGEPAWVVFQERLPRGTGGPSRASSPPGRSAPLIAKVTAAEPLDAWLEPGQEVVLRERGTVKAFLRLEEVRPGTEAWRLRRGLKGTVLHDSRAFWSDLKPPREVRLPPVHGARCTLRTLVAFEPVPQLAVGALTRQGEVLTLDCLEVGSSEDEGVNG